VSQSKPFLLRLNFDIWLAILGFTIAVVVALFSATVLNRDIYVLFGLLLGSTCLGWLFIRRREMVHAMEYEHRGAPLYALSSAFFLALFASILMFYFRPEGYVRPMAYFILTAVMAGAVALEVFSLPSGRAARGLVLLQIVALGASVHFSHAAIFPSVIGIDPALHFHLVDGIITTQQITEGADYSTTPLFHIEMAMGMMLTEADYKIVSALLTGIPNILIVPLSVFLLGRYLFDVRIGLMAALLISVAPYHLYFGVWAVPNTFAAISIPLIFYLMIRLRRERNTLPGRERNLATFALIVLLMAALVLTHPVASLVLATILFIIWSINRVCQMVLLKRGAPTVTLGMALFFVTLMLGWWTFVGDQIYFIGQQLTSGFQIGYLSSVPDTVASFVYQLPLAEQMMRYIGMFAFFSLGILGCFAIITKKVRNAERMTLAFIGLVPCGVGFVSLAFALSGLDARWFYVAEMFLAIPLAVIILAMRSKGRLKLATTVVAAGVVASLVFISILSPLGSIDNRELFPNTGIRYSFTDSELTGAQFISHYSDQPHLHGL